MATIDTTETFLLTNSYTLDSRLLGVSAADDGLLMIEASTAPSSAQWFVTDAGYPPFYRLHTVSGGNTQSLDVINTNGTNSTGLHMTGTGTYSGQYWRFDAWPGSQGATYPYRISNNFTGLDLHMDVYSDTLEPHLASGDATGQHWALSPAPRSTSTSTSASTTSTSTSSTTASTSTSTNETQNSNSGSSLSTGDYIGIAISGFVALAVITAFITQLIIKSRRRERNLYKGYEGQGWDSQGASGVYEYQSVTQEGQSVSSPISQNQQDYIHAAELGSNQNVIPPVELSGSSPDRRPEVSLYQKFSRLLRRIFMKPSE